MKKIIILSLSVLLFSLLAIPQNVFADTTNSQIITLSSGWNIISTPKVLLSHEFSVAETSDNFDIYLLDPISPSGWQTMQGIGQTEFVPLYAYFINNKTGQNQTLTFNYNLDLTPAQRLFQRTLQPGWNAIGIASPSYALSQGSANLDTNNPKDILNSINFLANQVIDFTAGNSNLDLPRITDTWASTTISDVNSLNDFRELKGYGIFIAGSFTSEYIGSQNLSDISNPESGLYLSKNDSYPNQSTFVPANAFKLADFTLTAKGEDINLKSVETYLQIHNKPIGNLYVQYGENTTEIATSDLSTHSWTIDHTLSSGESINVAIYADMLEGGSSAGGVDSSILFTGKTIASNEDVSTGIISGQTTTTTNSPILTATIGENTPDEASIRVDSTNGTTDVPMLVFNLKSTNGNSSMTDIKITVDGEAGAIEKVVAVKLYDGSTLLGSQSLSGPTATFADLSISVAKDATKTLTVKADFSAGVTSRKKVRLSIVDPTSDITYERSDLSSAHASGSAIYGNYMYVFDDEAAIFTFISAPTPAYNYDATTPSNSIAQAVFTFKVKSEGGTMTQPAAGHFDVRLANSSGDVATLTSAAGQLAVAVSPNNDVPDGSEATVTITAQINRATAQPTGAAPGLVYFYVYSADWTVTGTPTTVTDQTWGWDDYKTPYVTMY